MEVLKKKSRKRTNIWPSDPTPGHMSGENSNLKRYMDPSVYCSTIHNSQTWKQPKCLLTHKWIKKVYYIHTVGFYSVIKKDEITPFAATWMDLEIIIK